MSGFILGLPVLRRLSLVGLTALVLTCSGCSSTSLFQGFSGGGAQQTGVAGASEALDNGDYTAAINKANQVIESGTTSTADLQEAYLIKGQALMGSAGLTVTNLASSLTGVTDTGNVLALFPSTLVSIATASAQAINMAFDLTGTAAADPDYGTATPVDGVVTVSSLPHSRLRITSHVSKTDASSSLTQDRYVSRLTANLGAMVSMLTTVYTITTSGDITLNEGWTMASSLDYLYPTDASTGVLYYASIVAVTYPACGLSEKNQLIVLRAINAAVYVSYINAARKVGNPYIYKGSDNRTIRSTSTDEEIRSAVEFELKKVH